MTGDTAELTNGGSLSLHDRLARLGFSGYEARIEQTLKKCEEKEVMLPRQVLTEALNDIIAARDEQKAMMRMKMARFPVTTQTIETFAFSLLPDKLIELKIRKFAGCDWVRSHRNLFLCGNPGLGKTHLSIALGIRATQKVYRTLFIPAKDLFAELNASRLDNKYGRRLKTIQRNEVQIIDDLSSAIAPSPDIVDAQKMPFVRGSAMHGNIGMKVELTETVVLPQRIEGVRFLLALGHGFGCLPFRRI